ncbi:MAG: hypothetical protein JWP31_1127 [Aeromicrobium sp.]|nr:hypothetical protein [Aeromicrobium sp.]
MSHAALAPAVALTMVLVSGSPAAADPDVGLSNDGSSWGSELTRPLFDPPVTWVPGRHETSGFYVRNESEHDARVSVDLLGSTVDSLMTTGDLTVSARGDGEPWRDVSTPGTRRLVSGVRLRAGGSTRVDVAVAFTPAARNDSQTTQLDLDFRVRLVQQQPTARDGAEDGLLPDTGAPPLGTLVVASALVIGGLLLTSGRRAEEEDCDVQP